MKFGDKLTSHNYRKMAEKIDQLVSSGGHMVSLEASEDLAPVDMIKVAQDYREKAEELATIEAAAEADEDESYIASIEASALTPIKAVGDLAQMSTGASGTEVEVIGLMDWGVKWKRGVVTSTTTDGNGYASKLSSTAEWSATAKFAYIDADVSQTAIRSAITTLKYESSPFNFFNAPATGRDSFSGNGILTGLDFATGTGKIFGMDATIEGDGPLNIVPQLAPTPGTGNQSALVAED